MAALEAVADRADQQHAWVLAGDDRGTYGDYPPSLVVGVDHELGRYARAADGGCTSG
jgi:hypothetical protein